MFDSIFIRLLADLQLIVDDVFVTGLRWAEGRSVHVQMWTGIERQI